MEFQHLQAKANASILFHQQRFLASSLHFIALKCTQAASVHRHKHTGHHHHYLHYDDHLSSPIAADADAAAAACDLASFPAAAAAGRRAVFGIIIESSFV